MRNPIDTCLNQFVCVEANGVRYFGTLIEVGEEELYLRTDTRWVTVPVERVHSVRQVDPDALEDTGLEEVDADAYAPEEGLDEDDRPVAFGELDEPGEAEEDEIVDLTHDDESGEAPSS